MPSQQWYEYQTDNFTDNGTGAIVDVRTQPCKHFSLQVVGVGAAATAWTVTIEGSIDGTNYDELITHNTAVGNTSIVFSGANVFPVRFFRVRMAGLTLGSATSVNTYALGMQ